MFFNENFFNNPQFFGFETNPILDKSAGPENFLKIYLSFITDLDPRSAAILAHMVTNSDENDIYSGNYESLMQDFNISRSTLAGIMTRLQEKGFITKVKEGYKVSHEMKLPFQNGKIVIRVNNDKNIDSKLNKTITKHKEINKEKYNQYLNMAIESCDKLIKEDYNKEKLLEEATNCLNAYNEFLNNENDIDFLNFVKNQEFSSEFNRNLIIKLNKFYIDNKIENLEKILKPDISTNNYMATFDAYAGIIDSLDVSGETKLLMKEFLLNLIKVTSITKEGASFAHIHRILNKKDDFNNLLNAVQGNVSVNLIYNLANNYNTLHVNCLRAAFNIFNEKHFVVNYNNINRINI